MRRKMIQPIPSTGLEAEICTCGHTRAQHEQTYGACLEPCLCNRFTWDGNNPANLELMRKRAEERRQVMS